ncbi:hypothetical protein [Chryseobacterium herbae]|uniref:DUF4019 domain-containing protein n=1 Tax=Chryseobacterium herbae TaxID=2976476 RepID=A0ABT2IZR1_9FLAO|nr:hypothetical protein [Chryseobacterium sp. pc1-10]MCT2563981.1 hypothetical protein [Chryseobacterium sp. pc1-10]
MNKIIITAIVLSLSALNHAHAQKKITDNKPAAQQNTTKEAKETEKAKIWITRTVANTLNKANGMAENTNEEAEGKHKQIYTTQYMAYKDDAAETGMDGGMTRKAFEKKWAKDFNVQYAGVGKGYLVSNAYYGFIEVTQCVFIKKTGNAYLFETVITDTEAKINYKRDIKVIPSGNSFLIADVLEYNQ